MGQEVVLGDALSWLICAMKLQTSCSLGGVSPMGGWLPPSPVRSDIKPTTASNDRPLAENSFQPCLPGFSCPVPALGIGGQTCGSPDCWTMSPLCLFHSSKERLSPTKPEPACCPQQTARQSPHCAISGAPNPLQAPLVEKYFQYPSSSRKLKTNAQEA